MDQTQSIDSALPLILLGIIGMLLLAIAVIVFFIFYQRRLFAQQDKIRGMETAYQKDLLESSIEAQEVERKRVAIDLHDGVGSLLSAIRLYVAQFSSAPDAEDYEEMVTETKEMLDSAIEQTRGIAHNLLPTSLDRFGVLRALKDLCKRIEKLNAIDVSLTYDQEYTFAKQQDLAIYRIFQELINNTLKHAEASIIQLSFRELPDTIQIRYSDNGKGLDQEEVATLAAGLGFKSIESRINLIHGKMEVTSAKGQGFQFEMQVPKGKEE